MKAQQDKEEPTPTPSENQELPEDAVRMPLERVISKYEAKIGQLSTQNIMLETQLEQVGQELAEVKSQLVRLVDAMPKSESGDEAGDPAPATPLRQAARPANARKSAGAKKRR